MDKTLTKIKIVLFGGSFDPPHNGHLEIIKKIQKIGIADEVWIVPVFIPPFKNNPQENNQTKATAGDRLQMCKLIAEKRIKILDMEIKRGGKSYTVDTVLELKKQYPDYKFYFLIGSDWVCNLNKWHRAEELFKEIEFVSLPRTNISSSKIRERIKAGESISDMVPQKLKNILKKINFMFKYFSPESVTNKIINFLKNEVQSAGFKKVIIALSGGIDSAVVTFLAVKALGKENVLVIKLPHKDFNQDKDAELVISKLEIPKENVFEVEISGIVNSFISNLGDLSDLRIGNLMARVRMTILYDFAKRENALVCGTENKSENLLGYFTRFGDQASDLEPIINLYKTQVIELAKYLGVPEKIINKKPSAGLWSGQTDEGELGFSYEEADKILTLFFDKKQTWQEIKNSDLAGNTELINKVQKRVEDNKFKHMVPKLAIV